LAQALQGILLAHTAITTKLKQAKLVALQAMQARQQLYFSGCSISREILSICKQCIDLCGFGLTSNVRSGATA
jgi:hypothetical protein